MSSVGTINIGGLASGLDTQELIESLMEIDSQPLTKLESEKEDNTELSSVYTTMKTMLDDLETIVSDLRTSSTFNAFSASSSDEDALTVSASSTAEAGNVSIKILSLAQAETRSSDSFSDNDSALGLSGEISVNGKAVTIDANDSLVDIREAINTLDIGATASILKVGTSDYRLIISADEQGTEGFTLSNVGGSDILETLGFTDGTSEVREVDNGSVVSESFTTATATIGSLVGISESVSGTVTIRGEELTIDLSSDSLASIRDKINNLGISGVTAEIEAVDDDDSTVYRLAITGTTEYTDDNNVLETLGILTGGTAGISSVFESSTLYESESGDLADGSTLLSQLGSSTYAEETISISGYQCDGTTVSSTLTIDENTTVDDLLNAIEEAYDGDVTASIVDGVITIRSVTTGETALSVDISANNENGGSLDLGTIFETVAGRSRVVVEGTDAVLLVNNIKVSRNTNEISDVVTGVTLNLLEADPSTSLTITIDQDNTAIKESITEFVDSYNEFVEYYNEQCEYDEETEEGGALLGDLTARTIMNQLESILQSSLNDSSATYTQLAEIGIELTTEGTLDIDTSTLNDALNEDPDAVIALFTVDRSASDDDISFVYNSTKSSPGTYTVNITTAAEKATVESQAYTDRIGTSGTLSITDNLDASMEIEYTEDMTVSDLANLINSEADTTYSQQLASTTALVAEGSDGGGASQSTSIGDLEGVTVEKGDTITITATKHSGATVQTILTFTDGDTYTIQDILNEIASMNGDNATATLNSDGYIEVYDQKSGTSDLALSISTTIDGLDFGTFEVEQEGRTVVCVEASVSEDNSLVITHTSYGSAKTLNIEGGENLGIADGEYQGVDIAGTINGVAGTGKGTALTASTDDSSTNGIIISSTITAEELEEQGSYQGTITLVAGIAERMYSQLYSMTDSVDGLIQTELDSLESTAESLDDRIEMWEERLEQRRTLYVTRFTALEVAMSKLNSISEQMTSALSALS